MATFLHLPMDDDHHFGCIKKKKISWKKALVYPTRGWLEVQTTQGTLLAYSSFFFGFLFELVCFFFSFFLSSQKGDSKGQKCNIPNPRKKLVFCNKVFNTFLKSKVHGCLYIYIYISFAKANHTHQSCTFYYC
jgi:hypothetical protein